MNAERTKMPLTCPGHCATPPSHRSKHSSLLCQQCPLLISNVPSASTTAKAPTSAIGTDLAVPSVGTLHRHQWLVTARTCWEQRSAGTAGPGDPAPGGTAPAAPGRHLQAAGDPLRDPTAPLLDPNQPRSSGPASGARAAIPREAATPGDRPDRPLVRKNEKLSAKLPPLDLLQQEDGPENRTHVLPNTVSIHLKKESTGEKERVKSIWWTVFATHTLVPSDKIVSTLRHLEEPHRHL